MNISITDRNKVKIKWQEARELLSQTAIGVHNLKLSTSTPSLTAVRAASLTAPINSLKTCATPTTRPAATKGINHTTSPGLFGGESFYEDSFLLGDQIEDITAEKSPFPVDKRNQANASDLPEVKTRATSLAHTDYMAKSRCNEVSRKSFINSSSVNSNAIYKSLDDISYVEADMTEDCFAESDEQQPLIASRRSTPGTVYITHFYI